MLAFTLFFASIVMPLVLIGGLFLIAMQPQQRRVSLLSNVGVPVGADSLAAHDPHYDVPSSLVEGHTWHVHLN